MKRMISVLLAVLMLVSLCACGSAPAETPAAPAPAAPAEPAVQATEAADPYADMEPVVFNIATSYKEGPTTSTPCRLLAT